MLLQVRTYYFTLSVYSVELGITIPTPFESLKLELICILLLEFLFFFVPFESANSTLISTYSNVLCSSVCIFWIAVTLHCLEIQIGFKIFHEKGNGRSMISSTPFAVWWLFSLHFDWILVCTLICYLVLFLILEVFFVVSIELLCQRFRDSWSMTWRW